MGREIAREDGGKEMGIGGGEREGSQTATIYLNFRRWFLYRVALIVENKTKN